MKGIMGKAILFDMYIVQDPIVLAGEMRELLKVELKPVIAKTAQFRNIYINNIIKNRVAKANFVHDLSTLNVKNNVRVNMIIQANKGLAITEGTEIMLRNLQLIKIPI